MQICFDVEWAWERRIDPGYGLAGGVRLTYRAGASVALPELR
jgi:hypothetical protein